MSGHRIAARGAAAVVALVAGAASFSHIADVAERAGERTWVAYSLPLAIDGLIVVGVAALLEDRRDGRRPRMSARLAVLVGVVATLAANVASAEPTWLARAVAVTAPVAFLLSVEVLTRSGRRVDTEAPDITPPTADTAPVVVPDTPAELVDGQTEPEPEAPAPPRRRKAQRTSARALAAQRPDISVPELVEATGVSERHARRVLNGHVRT